MDLLGIKSHTLFVMDYYFFLFLFFSLNILKLLSCSIGALLWNAALDTCLISIRVYLNLTRIQFVFTRIMKSSSFHIHLRLRVAHFFLRV